MNLNKVCILTAEFPPQPGGIGNHSFNLAQGLTNHGYIVTVLCDIRSDTGEEEREFDASLNFEVVRIPRKKLIVRSYFHRITTAYKIVRRCEVIIASGKFQLWMGGLLSLSKKKKLIAVVHGSELLLPHKGLRELTQLSLRRFNIIVAVSNFTKSLLKRSSFKKAHVIYNGFHLQCDSLMNDNEESKPVLITVGNVTQRKGQQNVIKALPLLLKKYPDLQYFIVGIPTEKERLQELAGQLGVEEAIVFCGAVSEAEKCTMLRKSDIFLMLSERTEDGDVEGFGIALLEANSIGVPSIGAIGCGIQEAVKNGYSGLIVNPHDPVEVSASVEKILENYQEFSYNAVQWADRFRWEQVIGEYKDLLIE